MTKRVRLRGAQRKQSRPAVPMADRISRAAPVALAGVLLCALIAGLIYLPSVMDGYPIRAVQVEGVKDPRRQHEVQAVLEDLVSGENFFTLPLKRIYRDAKNLAWVDQARVRREWPDRVVLSIEERVPVAVWNSASLVSSSGERFEALQKYAVDSLPRLSGPDQYLATVMEYYHSMSKVLLGSGMRIRSLDVNARLTARLFLDNGIELMVDREQYANKLRRFARLYEGVLAQDSRRVKRVDLRYGDGMAVTWQPVADKESDERV